MIRSRFTLKQIEAFVAVVDSGSFRKAASALGTTQPNISARIASLEDTLDIILLYRDAGSVRLTESGRILDRAARNMLWAGEEFLEAADRKDMIDERMRLGVTEMIACTWLHSFLRTFRVSYPKVKVELKVDLSREIDRSLTAGQLDLALQTAPFQSDLANSQDIGSYRYIWTAPPDVAELLGPSPNLSTIFEHPILTHAAHTQASKELLSLAGKNGLPLDQVVHSSSLASCLPMAVDGMGIALLPRQIVALELDRGRLVELDSDWVPSELHVFARYHEKRAPRFVRYAAEIAKEIAAKHRR